MNHGTEKLLTEVLAEGASADFRAALLAETLRAARRRRQVRQTRNGLGILCAVILLAVFWRRNFSTPPRLAPVMAQKAIAPAYELVRTEPLPDRCVISTESFPEIATVTSVATVEEVATTRGNFRRISDDELLALVASRPAVLIRTGPDSEELIFADAAGQITVPGGKEAR